MANLLERIAAGDQPAVQLCVERYGDLVWSIALRLLRDRNEAEDVVQETFVDLWRSAGRFDPAVASEATFVAMVTRRRVYDRLRRRGRRPDEDGSIELDRFPSRTGAERAEARLAARALDQLDEKERHIILLSLHEGMSHSEIATRLSLPLGTVKTRARRGLIRLRALLSDDGADSTGGSRTLREGVVG
ncbi:MAG: sigma-70 family RNA polymerase sigma factor [Myxococcota bacterium]